jgi:hypothetical protein
MQVDRVCGESHQFGNDEAHKKVRRTTLFCGITVSQQTLKEYRLQILWDWKIPVFFALVKGLTHFSQNKVRGQPNGWL